uniref:Cysteine synthase n=1 Tax=Panagrolaimus davidi TaxID=227884 RepID=A0A914Q969_9BILA
MADRESIGCDVSDIVGNTPMVYLNKVSKGCKGKVAIKLEYYNPACSVKDRIAKSMILEAEKAGTIDPEKTVLVEVTSGNTGIGLASIAAARGYKLIIVMPSACSLERRTLLRAFGAELVLTARAGGIVEAIKCAEDIHKSMPNSFFVNQLGNPANPNIHYETTGPEIWKQTQGKVDAIVIGIGTGGTIMGTAKFLREKNPNLRVFAVEPAESALFNGGEIKPHKIQGIGIGVKPPIVDEKVFEKCITVKSDDAIEMAKRLAREEGILSGISGGANVIAAIEVANLEEMKGKLIVTCIPSFGERYLSTPLYSDIREEVSSLKEKPLGEALDPDYFNFKSV